MTNYTPKDIDRFWSKFDLSNIDEDFACCEWTSYTTAGYGQIGLQGKRRYAHRVAYELAWGEFPDNLFVCHHCDNPACCNPNHLFLGGQGDNMRDMSQKGRRNPSRGEKQWMCKLSDAQVVEIRQRYAQGDITFKELGREYGVHETQIGRIVRYQNRRVINKP